MSRFPNEPKVSSITAGSLKSARIGQAWRTGSPGSPALPGQLVGLYRKCPGADMPWKIADAEGLLEAGQRDCRTKRHYSSIMPAMAELRRDWVALESRCAPLRERFPDEQLPYAGGAMALRNLGRYDEADALLTDADLRFDHSAFWVEYARSADDRGDWKKRSLAAR